MGELTLLGKITITATPSDNAEVFHVELVSENRDEAVQAETQSGETIDQFILRLKGMLKAMFNAPLKKEMQNKEKEKQRQGLISQVMGKK